MKLEELKVYNESMILGEEIWQFVNGWGSFDKFTLGKQLVNSADSVAANISEGFGRYHFKESKHFTYILRGSLYETKTWLTKAKNRDLINKSEYLSLISKLNILGKMLNAYIKSIGTPSK
jgi:four helix bundle protein